MLALFTAFGRDQMFNKETVSTMRGFYGPLDWKEAGQWKLSYLCGDLACFIGQVAEHIDPYWDCLKQPFTDLWQDVFDGIRLYPTNKEDLPLFEPKHHGPGQLLADRKRRSDNSKKRSEGRKQRSDDRKRHSGDHEHLSEGAGGYLKNDLPITHDIFLIYLNEMLEIAESEDEREEEEEKALQLGEKQARKDLEAAKEVVLLAKRHLRSRTQALNSIRQPRGALPTESSSTSTGPGNTADSLDSSATIQDQPWNPFTGIRGESLILENYDDGVPKAPEPVNNYFTPLSCIGISQTAQVHVPSLDLPSANHAPLVTRAFPFTKKRANPDGDGDFESRVSKRQKSVKSGKMKKASSRGTGKRSSRKEKGGLRASSTLLGELRFQQIFRIDGS